MKISLFLNSLINKTNNYFNITKNKINYYEFIVIFALTISSLILSLDKGYAKVSNILFVISILTFFYAIKNKTIKLNLIETIRDLKIIFLLFFIIITSALVSLIFAADVSETLRYIRLHIVYFIIFFVTIYWYSKHQSDFALSLFLYLFGIVLLSGDLIITYKYFFSEPIFGFRFSATDSNLIIPFGYWHVIAFMFFLSIFFAIKNIKIKILFFMLILLSLFAMFATGTRSFLLSSIVAFLCSLIFFQYKYKKYILSLFITIIIILSIFVYKISANWDTFGGRFNINKSINNFNIIWSVPPSFMGKFSKCFENICHKNSLKPDPNIRFDTSALIRLSLLKSGLLAIKENPFKPNGFGAELFSKNLEKNHFKSTDLNYPFVYLGPHFDTPNKTYHHMHNQIVSFIFELGIIGAMGIYIFMFIIFLTSFKVYKNTNNIAIKIFASFMMLYILTSSFSAFFDIMFHLSGILQMSILCGFIFGLQYRKKI